MNEVSLVLVFLRNLPRVLFVGGEFCFVFGEMNGRIREEKKGKQNYYKKATDSKTYH